MSDGIALSARYMERDMAYSTPPPPNHKKKKKKKVVPVLWCLGCFVLASVAHGGVDFMRCVAASNSERKANNVGSLLARKGRRDSDLPMLWTLTWRTGNAGCLDLGMKPGLALERIHSKRPGHVGTGKGKYGKVAGVTRMERMGGWRVD